MRSRAFRSSSTGTNACAKIPAKPVRRHLFLLRKEPDEEEDEEEDGDDRKEEDDDGGKDDGYSEWAYPWVKHEA